jgi:hypothetical protein
MHPLPCDLDGGELGAGVGVAVADGVAAADAPGLDDAVVGAGFLPDVR